MGATVSARQAATLCNVSGTTVQRWIASGRLHATLVDGAYRIAVEDLAPFQAGHRATGAPDTGAAVQANTPPDTVAPPERQINVRRVAPEAGDPGVAELVCLVREQAERLEKYAGQIGFLQARVQDLEREIRLLSAPAAESINLTDLPPDPAPAPTPNPSAPSPNDQHSASYERESRPWWRRWLGSVG